MATALTRHDPKLLIEHADGWLRPAAPQGFWIHVPLPDGKAVEGGTPGLSLAYPPDFARRVFAAELASRLNRHLAHGGVWCTGWTDWPPGDVIGTLPVALIQPRRLLMPWFDQDLDMPILVDAEDHFLRMVNAIDDYLQQCAEALELRLREWLKQHDVKQGRDTIQATLGQRSADPHAMNPLAPFD